MSRALPQLSIVVPCYNEAEVLPAAAKRLCEVLNGLVEEGQAARGSSISFVDDGSTDNTWQLIVERSAADSRIRGIRLSRNFGHQHALLAGMLTGDADAVVTLDADLQDDPAVIREMVAAYVGGAEIVFGVRNSRNSDSWLKRSSAETFYTLMRFLGVDVVFNHADFRLMGRAAVEAVRQHQEVNLFLRALVANLGFRTATVQYERQPRKLGETKYSAGKMLRLAIEGITSFSAVPLQMITVLGCIVSVLSLAAAGWALWVRLENPAAVPGWASTVIPLYFLGGVQMLCLGIIGQYVAKIYIESKRRPRFIVEQMVGAGVPDARREASAAPSAK